MSRVFGLTVARNEVGRYLVPVLSAVHEIVDEHFLYDDRSDDGTPDAALAAGSKVEIRDECTPSFIENEGAFRQRAWDAFERVCRPRLGDWILAIDADEFLVTTGDCCTRCALDKSLERAMQLGSKSVILPVKEIFGFDSDLAIPMVRTDGEWGKIQGTRLFAYQAKGRFRDKRMGSGSEPNYVQVWAKSPVNFGLHILHYGYATEEDQKAKYERYTSLMDHGHANAHIQSIIGPKVHELWDGPVPWTPDPPEEQAA